MKKTIWIPVLIGVIFGVLAGISTAASLTYMLGGWAIGFYLSLYILSAALGGPVAGVITSTLDMIATVLFGPPDMKAFAANPNVFWTNVLVVGVCLIIAGFAYRYIFEHFRMPMRLLPWIGIVIFYYIFTIPLLVIIQRLLGTPFDPSVAEYILASWKALSPQAISDIIITSVIWLALPERFRKPLWYEPKVKTPPAAEKA
jgi:MFS family permease